MNSKEALGDKGNTFISNNGRYLQNEKGEPFFWMADTGWLLFQNLSLEETSLYFEKRRNQGFNVILAMVLHSRDDQNLYGHPALKEESLTETFVKGSPDTEGKNSYWKHVETVIDMAADCGLYIALVPAWGSLINQNNLTRENAAAYGEWLAKQYGSKPNIFWIMGGDIRGDVKPEVWQTLAATIKQQDSRHLMTYHPFGRTQSSTWFHNETWLDFNMFQSGHRRYNQRMSHSEEDDENIGIGQDNWRYVQDDYEKKPHKPTLDGEPSYESIPQGLHDPSQPYWTARDARRYAYWAVFSGACGHTYGHNAVMQMHKPGSGAGSYGVREFWDDALEAEGARQMQWLKTLILSQPYFERVPDQNLIASEIGEQYKRIVATRGPGYILVYLYMPRPVKIKTEFLKEGPVFVQWMNPRNGGFSEVQTVPNHGVLELVPPGIEGADDDSVLILTDDKSRCFP